MTPKHYPECPSWRGFGWWFGAGPAAIRVLGHDGARVRVEYPHRPDRPRAWLSMAEPRFSGLRAWIAKAPTWANPAVIPGAPEGERQGSLFGGIP